MFNNYTSLAKVLVDLVLLEELDVQLALLRWQAQGPGGGSANALVLLRRSASRAPAILALLTR